MERKWDGRKSIVNGQCMRAMRHPMEYQVPARLGDENVGIDNQYTSTMTKLPFIKKEPIRKKVVLHSYTVNKTPKSNTVSQPCITVEKKRVHARQPSSKANVTRFRDATVRRDEVKWHERPKQPRKAKIQKHRFTEKARQTEIQPPCLQQNTRSHNDEQDQVLTFTSTPLPELSRDLQTITDPMSLTLSPIQTSVDSFNIIPEMNTEDDIGNHVTASINDESNENDSVCIAPLPLRPVSYGVSLAERTEHSIWRNRFLEIDEETSSVCEIDDLPVFHRINRDINAESTRNILDTNTNNLPSLTSPRSLGLRTLSQVADNSQTSAQDSFSNLRDMTELRRLGVAMAPSNREHNRLSHAAETALSQLNNIDAYTRNMQNHEYLLLPQTTFGTEGDRQRTTDGSEASSGMHFTSLGPSLSSTAPTTTILHENPNLIANAISMQRQFERIIHITQGKQEVKPKPDPEKIKKIQESLLEEDSEDEGDVCRICLAGGETSENQLLAPCRCRGSLKFVHKECMKKWLLSKIKSGATLSDVKTCEMCKENVKCDSEEFNVDESFRRHRKILAILNPSLYLVLLLRLHQQRYEELLQLTNIGDGENGIARQLSNQSFVRREYPTEDNQNI